MGYNFGRIAFREIAGWAASVLHRDTMRGLCTSGYPSILMRVVAICCFAVLVIGAGHTSQVQPWMILYIGPDLLLPFTSAIAAAVGVVLMFWHRLTGWVRSVWRMIFRRKA